MNERIFLAEGLTLKKNNDGTWLSFSTKTGLTASINLDTNFRGEGIINKAVLGWAKEQISK